MRLILPLLLISLFSSAIASAQDVRYVSDKQLIPVRSGAGNDYRIVNAGLPSGTRLTVKKTSKNGLWAQISTERGTNGWMRTQYLTKDKPAQNKLDEAIRRADQATQQQTALAEQVESLKLERVELLNTITNADTQLGGVSDELTQLKKISGNAEQLDIDNRRLLQDTEALRSEVETLESENQRLMDKLESEDFLNGALAVLLGVIITLVVPRLWPKRRKSSSWA